MHFIFTVICAALAAAFSLVLLSPEANLTAEQVSIEAVTDPDL